jgi:hypothetical protein
VASGIWFVRMQALYGTARNARDYMISTQTSRIGGFIYTDSDAGLLRK